MAYVADALVLNDIQVSGYTPRVWRYTTAADSLATITAAGYFSNGYTAGMRVGDIVDVIATTGPKYVRLQVTASVKNGASTVSTPTAIT